MKKQKKPQLAIVTAFSLKPEQLAQLTALARFNGNNKSMTIQQLIEAAWLEQSAKEQR